MIFFFLIMWLRPIVCQPEWSWDRGQDSLMWDIVWISPQGPRSESVRHQVFLQTWCTWPVRKRFRRDTVVVLPSDVHLERDRKKTFDPMTWREVEVFGLVTRPGWFDRSTVSSKSSNLLAANLQQHRFQTTEILTRPNLAKIVERETRFHLCLELESADSLRRLSVANSSTNAQDSLCNQYSRPCWWA